MDGTVSKLTCEDSEDRVDFWAGVLFVAESWARTPRHAPGGMILDPGAMEIEVRALLVEMQQDEEMRDATETEPAGPARFPE